MKLGERTAEPASHHRPERVRVPQRNETSPLHKHEKPKSHPPSTLHTHASQEQAASSPTHRPRHLWPGKVRHQCAHGSGDHVLDPIPPTSFSASQGLVVGRGRSCRETGVSERRKAREYSLQPGVSSTPSCTDTSAVHVVEEL